METVTPDPSRFAVKTGVFEGPMELLIELVEKRKLLINDIALAEVTDEYMQRVSAMQELSLPNTAQFIALAATLLLIKSKSLLPALELTEEEEGSIEELESRLRQYQIFRDASALLSNAYGRQPLFTPEYTPPREALFVSDEYCAVPALREAMQRVLTELPKPEVAKPKVQVRPTISLEDMMTRLQKRIETQMQTKFSELRAGEVEHKNVIVGFLAILELCKQGNIIITQHSRFEDIHMEMERGDVPRYY